MNFFGKCSNNALTNAAINIQREVDAGFGAGNFKWEDMDEGTRMGKIVELAEKNKKNLNCSYKNDKANVEEIRKGVIKLPDKGEVHLANVMDVSSDMVFLSVYYFFVKNKEKTPALKKEGASGNLMAKLGGRRRRRTKKRKSRRRRRKRTKKKRRRKSRKSRRRRRR